MVSIVTNIAGMTTSTLAVPYLSFWVVHYWVDPQHSAASVGACIHIKKREADKYGIQEIQSIW